MNLLNEIVSNKRGELEASKKTHPVADLRDAARSIEDRPAFAAALRAAPIGLIAEVKRRSPSAGAIRDPMDPGETAGAYEKAGAQAVSCLLDSKYFGGGEEDFRAVRAAVGLPLLYKEFVVDPWQVWHASSLGASAVLLIVAALAQSEIESLLHVCREAGLEALIEVHSEEEMAVARSVGGTLVGINNRDLKTFSVSLETSLRLAADAPHECTLISESGIRSADDVARLKAGGMHGVLVGEQLLRRPDIETAVRELMAKV